MPLNPSSYSKIFKSKYVQDDDEEEVNLPINVNVNDENNEDNVSSSVYVPSYSNPKVQELLSKPKLDFDKIFSSKYLQDDFNANLTTTTNRNVPSFRSSSIGFDRKPEKSTITLNKSNITSNSSVSSVSIASLPSSIPPPAKDYDKIFTSRYLNDDYPSGKGSKSVKSYKNPYLSDNDDEDDDVGNDDIYIKHLPPSRGGSIRRSVPPINSSKFNESYPSRNRNQFNLTKPAKLNYDDDDLESFESKPLRKIYSRSVTPSIRSTDNSYLNSPSPSNSNYSTFSRRNKYDYDDSNDKNDSSLVLDANLTFILGCKSKLKENVKAVPAFKETDTKSNALSSKIADFLSRTDHVMEEWGELGKNRKRKCEKISGINGKSKSATNIMIKGFQLYSKANSVDRGMSSRSGGVCEDEENTQYEIDEV